MISLSLSRHKSPDCLALMSIPIVLLVMVLPPRAGILKKSMVIPPVNSVRTGNLAGRRRNDPVMSPTNKQAMEKQLIVRIHGISP